MTAKESKTLQTLVLGILVLVAARTFNYWQFYLYLAIIFIPMIIAQLYFLKNDPSFLEHRIRAKEKEKEQFIIQIVFSFIFLSGFIIPGLDKRFGWSNVPLYVIIIADMVILLGYLLIFFVFKQNSYASRIVEVEKNQTIITTGLYSFVLINFTNRHFPNNFDKN